MLGKLTACGLVLSLASACVTTAPAGADRSPISLMTRFHQVAFFDESLQEENTLLRHSGPLHIVVKNGNPEDIAHAKKVAAQIADATGLDARVIPEAPGDVVVKFVDQSEWEWIARTVRGRMEARGIDASGHRLFCTVSTIQTGTGVRPFQLVRIPQALDRKNRNQCLAQELAHTTGLRYDTDGRGDTVFAGGLFSSDHLTEVDRQLLRILYDPRLRPGMTWDEARPFVKQIISEIEGRAPTS